MKWESDEHCTPDPTLRKQGQEGCKFKASLGLCFKENQNRKVGEGREKDTEYVGTREVARLGGGRGGRVRKSRKLTAEEGLKPTGDSSNPLTNLLPTVCGGRLL